MRFRNFFVYKRRDEVWRLTAHAGEVVRHWYGRERLRPPTVNDSHLKTRSFLSNVLTVQLSVHCRSISVEVGSTITLMI